MRLSSSIVPLLLLLATACASGRTIEERRATIDAEIARGLDKLATVRPDVRTMLEEAPAYAVFSTYDVVLGWVVEPGSASTSTTSPESTSI
jgi:hypothetical protein